MSAYTGDSWLDDELRNVPLPADLLPKLHSIAMFDDAEMDRALGNIAVPAGLFDRLRAIGTNDEVDVEDELRHVALPASLLERLWRIPAVARHVRAESAPWRHLAVAASLLIAVGVGYLAAISSPWFSRSTDPRRDIAAKNDRPAATTGKMDSQTANTHSPRDDRTFPPLPLAQDNTPPATAPKAANDPPPKLAETSKAMTTPVVVDQDPPSTDALAAPAITDRVPPLRSVSLPVWRGVSPPRERGYDLAFQLRHGVHPRVSPAASQSLAVSTVPLITSTSSFDAAWQLSQERKLPPGHRIRTEEFLAAMDYDFAPPQNRSIAIRSALAPSPWAPGLSLMQVAAQARSISSDTAGSHLIVLLDASPAVDWESRWEAALLGLAGFAEDMPPAARLSLILTRAGAPVMVERQTGSDAVQTIRHLQLQPPDAQTNTQIADSIKRAAELAAQGAQGGSSAGVLLLTDGVSDVDETGQQQCETALEALRKAGHRVSIIDIRQEQTIDTKMSRLADAAGAKESAGDERAGIVRHAGSAREIRWTLAEAAVGRSQVVASRATMKVTFKPDAVATYRLMGHEATSVVGLLSSTIEADLHSGEAATGLFEVELRPDGGETVADVEVTWHNPSTGAPQTIRQTVTRLQLSPSFYQAPMSVQLAALAAETAEILRDSHFAPPNSHSLAGVADLAAKLSPRLHSRPSFAKLMSLVQRAQRSQPVSR